MKKMIQLLTVVGFAAVLGVGCGGGSGGDVYVESMDTSELSAIESSVDGAVRGNISDAIASMESGDVAGAVDALGKAAQSKKLTPEEATACLNAATSVQKFISSTDDETIKEYERPISDVIGYLAPQATP